MADLKISGATAVTTVAGTNELVINEAGTSKKVTVDQLADFLGMKSRALSSQYTNNTTTGTEVTGLTVALSAGTWQFKYGILTQAAATGTGSAWGINYDGSLTAVVARLYYLGTGTTASSGVIDDDSAGATDQVMEAFVTRTASTTAPDLGPFTGVSVANTNNLFFIVGTIIVSNSGNLELWANSDTASSQITAEIGSCVMVSKVA
jgi:hypothetical protein